MEQVDSARVKHKSRRPDGGSRPSLEEKERKARRDKRGHRKHDKRHKDESSHDTGGEVAGWDEDQRAADENQRSADEAAARKREPGKIPRPIRPARKSASFHDALYSSVAPLHGDVTVRMTSSLTETRSSATARDVVLSALAGKVKRSSSIPTLTRAFSGRPEHDAPSKCGGPREAATAALATASSPPASPSLTPRRSRHGGTATAAASEVGGQGTAPRGPGGRGKTKRLKRPATGAPENGAGPGVDFSSSALVKHGDETAAEWFGTHSRIQPLRRSSRKHEGGEDEGEAGAKPPADGRRRKRVAGLRSSAPLSVTKRDDRDGGGGATYRSENAAPSTTSRSARQRDEYDVRTSPLPAGTRGSPATQPLPAPSTPPPPRPRARIRASEGGGLTPGSERARADLLPALAKDKLDHHHRRSTLYVGEEFPERVGMYARFSPDPANSASDQYRSPEENSDRAYDHARRSTSDVLMPTDADSGERRSVVGVGGSGDKVRGARTRAANKIDGDRRAANCIGLVSASDNIGPADRGVVDGTTTRPSPATTAVSNRTPAWPAGGGGLEESSGVGEEEEEGGGDDERGGGRICIPGESLPPPLPDQEPVDRITDDRSFDLSGEETSRYHQRVSRASAAGTCLRYVGDDGSASTSRESEARMSAGVSLTGAGAGVTSVDEGRVERGRGAAVLGTQRYDCYSSYTAVRDTAAPDKGDNPTSTRLSLVTAHSQSVVTQRHPLNSQHPAVPDNKLSAAGDSNRDSSAATGQGGGSDGRVGEDQSKRKPRSRQKVADISNWDKDNGDSEKHRVKDSSVSSRESIRVCKQTECDCDQLNVATSCPVCQRYAGSDPGSDDETEDRTTASTSLLQRQHRHSQHDTTTTTGSTPPIYSGWDDVPSDRDEGGVLRFTVYSESGVTSHSGTLSPSEPTPSVTSTVGIAADSWSHPHSAESDERTEGISGNVIEPVTSGKDAVLNAEEKKATVLSSHPNTVKGDRRHVDSNSSSTDKDSSISACAELDRSLEETSSEDAGTKESGRQLPGVVGKPAATSSKAFHKTSIPRRKKAKSESAVDILDVVDTRTKLGSGSLSASVSIADSIRDITATIKSARDTSTHDRVVCSTESVLRSGVPWKDSNLEYAGVSAEADDRESAARKENVICLTRITDRGRYEAGDDCDVRSSVCRSGGDEEFTRDETSAVDATVLSRDSNRGSVDWDAAVTGGRGRGVAPVDVSSAPPPGALVGDFKARSKEDADRGGASVKAAAATLTSTSDPATSERSRVMSPPSRKKGGVASKENVGGRSRDRKLGDKRGVEDAAAGSARTSDVVGSAKGRERTAGSRAMRSNTSDVSCVTSVRSSASSASKSGEDSKSRKSTSVKVSSRATTKASKNKNGSDVTPPRDVSSDARAITVVVRELGQTAGRRSASPKQKQSKENENRKQKSASPQPVARPLDLHGEGWNDHQPDRKSPAASPAKSKKSSAVTAPLTSTESKLDGVKRDRESAKADVVEEKMKERILSPEKEKADSPTKERASKDTDSKQTTPKRMSTRQTAQTFAKQTGPKAVQKDGRSTGTSNAKDSKASETAKSGSLLKKQASRLPRRSSETLSENRTRLSSTSSSRIRTSASSSKLTMTSSAKTETSLKTSRSSSAVSTRTTSAKMTSSVESDVSTTSLRSSSAKTETTLKSTSRSTSSSASRTANTKMTSSVESDVSTTSSRSSRSSSLMSSTSSSRLKTTHSDAKPLSKDRLSEKEKAEKKMKPVSSASRLLTSTHSLRVKKTLSPSSVSECSGVSTRDSSVDSRVDDGDSHSVSSSLSRKSVRSTTSSSISCPRLKTKEPAIKPSGRATAEARVTKTQRQTKLTTRKSGAARDTATPSSTEPAPGDKRRRSSSSKPADDDTGSTLETALTSRVRGESSPEVVAAAAKEGEELSAAAFSARQARVSTPGSGETEERRGKVREAGLAEGKKAVPKGLSQNTATTRPVESTTSSSSGHKLGQSGKAVNTTRTTRVADKPVRKSVRDEKHAERKQTADHKGRGEIAADLTTDESPGAVEDARPCSPLRETHLSETHSDKTLSEMSQSEIPLNESALTETTLPDASLPDLSRESPASDEVLSSARAETPDGGDAKKEDDTASKPLSKDTSPSPDSVRELQRTDAGIELSSDEATRARDKAPVPSEVRGERISGSAEEIPILTRDSLHRDATGQATELEAAPVSHRTRPWTREAEAEAACSSVASDLINESRADIEPSSLLRDSPARAEEGGEEGRGVEREGEDVARKQSEAGEGGGGASASKAPQFTSNTSGTRESGPLPSGDVIKGVGEAVPGQVGVGPTFSPHAPHSQPDARLCGLSGSQQLASGQPRTMGEAGLATLVTSQDMVGVDAGGVGGDRLDFTSPRDAELGSVTEKESDGFVFHSYEHSLNAEDKENETETDNYSYSDGADKLKISSHLQSDRSGGDYGSAVTLITGGTHANEDTSFNTSQQVNASDLESAGYDTENIHSTGNYKQLTSAPVSVQLRLSSATAKDDTSKPVSDFREAQKDSKLVSGRDSDSGEKRDGDRFEADTVYRTRDTKAETEKGERCEQFEESQSEKRTQAAAAEKGGETPHLTTAGDEEKERGGAGSPHYPCPLQEEEEGVDKKILYEAGIEASTGDKRVGEVSVSVSDSSGRSDRPVKTSSLHAHGGENSLHKISLPNFSADSANELSRCRAAESNLGLPESREEVMERKTMTAETKKKERSSRGMNGSIVRSERREEGEETVKHGDVKTRHSVKRGDADSRKRTSRDVTEARLRAEREMTSGEQQVFRQGDLGESRRAKVTPGEKNARSTESPPRQTRASGDAPTPHRPHHRSSHQSSSSTSSGSKWLRTSDAEDTVSKVPRRASSSRTSAAMRKMMTSSHPPLLSHVPGASGILRAPSSRQRPRSTPCLLTLPLPPPSSSRSKNLTSETMTSPISMTSRAKGRVVMQPLPFRLYHRDAPSSAGGGGVVMVRGKAGVGGAVPREGLASVLPADTALPSVEPWTHFPAGNAAATGSACLAEQQDAGEARAAADSGLADIAELSAPLLPPSSSGVVTSPFLYPAPLPVDLFPTGDLSSAETGRCAVPGGGGGGRSSNAGNLDFSCSAQNRDYSAETSPEAATTLDMSCSVQNDDYSPDLPGIAAQGGVAVSTDSPHVLTDTDTVTHLAYTPLSVSVEDQYSTPRGAGVGATPDVYSTPVGTLSPANLTPDIYSTPDGSDLEPEDSSDLDLRRMPSASTDSGSETDPSQLKELEPRGFKPQTAHSTDRPVDAYPSAPVPLGETGEAAEAKETGEGVEFVNPCRTDSVSAVAEGMLSFYCSSVLPSDEPAKNIPRHHQLPPSCVPPAVPPLQHSPSSVEARGEVSHSAQEDSVAVSDSQTSVPCTGIGSGVSPNHYEVVTDDGQFASEGIEQNGFELRGEAEGEEQFHVQEDHRPAQQQEGEPQHYEEQLRHQQRTCSVSNGRTEEGTAPQPSVPAASSSPRHRDNSDDFAPSLDRCPSSATTTSDSCSDLGQLSARLLMEVCNTQADLTQKVYRGHDSMSTSGSSGELIFSPSPSSFNIKDPCTPSPLSSSSSPKGALTRRHSESFHSGVSSSPHHHHHLMTASADGLFSSSPGSPASRSKDSVSPLRGELSQSVSPEVSDRLQFSLSSDSVSSELMIHRSQHVYLVNSQSFSAEGFAASSSFVTESSSSLMSTSSPAAFSVVTSSSVTAVTSSSMSSSCVAAAMTSHRESCEAENFTSVVRVSVGGDSQRRRQSSDVIYSSTGSDVTHVIGSDQKGSVFVTGGERHSGICSVTAGFPSDAVVTSEVNAPEGDDVPSVSSQETCVSEPLSVSSDDTLGRSEVTECSSTRASGVEGDVTKSDGNISKPPTSRSRDSRREETMTRVRVTTKKSGPVSAKPISTCVQDLQKMTQEEHPGKAAKKPPQPVTLTSVRDSVMKFETTGQTRSATVNVRATTTKGSVSGSSGTSTLKRSSSSSSAVRTPLGKSTEDKSASGKLKSAGTKLSRSVSTSRRESAVSTKQNGSSTTTCVKVSTDFSSSSTKTSVSSSKTSSKTVNMSSSTAASSKTAVISSSTGSKKESTPPALVKEARASISEADTRDSKIAAGLGVTEDEKQHSTTATTTKTAPREGTSEKVTPPCSHRAVAASSEAVSSATIPTTSKTEEKEKEDNNNTNSSSSSSAAPPPPPPPPSPPPSSPTNISHYDGHSRAMSKTSQAPLPAVSVAPASLISVQVDGSCFGARAPQPLSATHPHRETRAPPGGEGGERGEGGVAVAEEEAGGDKEYSAQRDTRSVLSPDTVLPSAQRSATGPEIQARETQHCEHTHTVVRTKASAADNNDITGGSETEDAQRRSQTEVRDVDVEATGQSSIASLPPSTRQSHAPRASLPTVSNNSDSTAGLAEGHPDVNRVTEPCPPAPSAAKCYVTPRQQLAAAGGESEISPPSPFPPSTYRPQREASVPEWHHVTSNEQRGERCEAEERGLQQGEERQSVKLHSGDDGQRAQGDETPETSSQTSQVLPASSMPLSSSLAPGEGNGFQTLLPAPGDEGKLLLAKGEEEEGEGYPLSGTTGKTVLNADLQSSSVVTYSTPVSGAESGCHTLTATASADNYSLCDTRESADSLTSRDTSHDAVSESATVCERTSVSIGGRVSVVIQDKATKFTTVSAKGDESLTGKQSKEGSVPLTMMTAKAGSKKTSISITKPQPPPSSSTGSKPQTLKQAKVATTSATVVQEKKAEASSRPTASDDTDADSKDSQVVVTEERSVPDRDVTKSVKSTAQSRATVNVDEIKPQAGEEVVRTTDAVLPTCSGVSAQYTPVPTPVPYTSAPAQPSSEPLEKRINESKVTSQSTDSLKVSSHEQTTDSAAHRSEDFAAGGDSKTSTPGPSADGMSHATAVDVNVPDKLVEVKLTPVSGDKGVEFDSAESGVDVKQTVQPSGEKAEKKEEESHKKQRGVTDRDSHVVNQPTDASSLPAQTSITFEQLEIETTGPGSDNAPSLRTQHGNGQAVVAKWKRLVRTSRVSNLKETLTQKLSAPSTRSESVSPPPAPVSPTPPRKYRWAREGGIWKKIYLSDSGYDSEMILSGEDMTSSLRQQEGDQPEETRPVEGASEEKEEGGAVEGAEDKEEAQPIDFPSVLAMSKKFEQEGQKLNQPDIRGPRPALSKKTPVDSKTTLDADKAVDGKHAELANATTKVRPQSGVDRSSGDKAPTFGDKAHGDLIETRADGGGLPREAEGVRLRIVPDPPVSSHPSQMGVTVATRDSGRGQKPEHADAPRKEEYGSRVSFPPSGVQSLTACYGGNLHSGPTVPSSPVPSVSGDKMADFASSLSHTTFASSHVSSFAPLPCEAERRRQKDGEGEKEKGGGGKTVAGSCTEIQDTNTGIAAAADLRLDNIAFADADSSVSKATDRGETCLPAPLNQQQPATASSTTRLGQGDDDDDDIIQPQSSLHPPTTTTTTVTASNSRAGGTRAATTDDKKEGIAGMSTHEDSSSSLSHKRGTKALVIKTVVREESSVTEIREREDSKTPAVDKVADSDEQKTGRIDSRAQQVDEVSQSSQREMKTTDFNAECRSPEMVRAHSDLNTTGSRSPVPIRLSEGFKRFQKSRGMPWGQQYLQRGEGVTSPRSKMAASNWQLLVSKVTATSGKEAVSKQGGEKGVAASAGTVGSARRKETATPHTAPHKKEDAVEAETAVDTEDVTQQAESGVGDAEPRDKTPRTVTLPADASPVTSTPSSVTSPTMSSSAATSAALSEAVATCIETTFSDTVFESVVPARSAPSTPRRGTVTPKRSPRSTPERVMDGAQELPETDRKTPERKTPERSAAPVSDEPDQESATSSRVSEQPPPTAETVSKDVTHTGETTAASSSSSTSSRLKRQEAKSQIVPDDSVTSSVAEDKPKTKMTTFYLPGEEGEATPDTDTGVPSSSPPSTSPLPVSPQRGSRSGTSAKLISMTVWDTHDGDKTLRSGARRVFWELDSKELLAGISEHEEACSQDDPQGAAPKTSTATSSAPAYVTRSPQSTPEKRRDASRDRGDVTSAPSSSSSSAASSQPRRRRHTRRSLSLPTGGLSYGDVKISYRDGHFVAEPVDGGDQQQQRDSDRDREDSGAGARRGNYHRAASDSGTVLCGSLMNIGSREEMRQEILSLLERGFSTEDITLLFSRYLDQNSNHLGRSGSSQSTQSLTAAGLYSTTAQSPGPYSTRSLPRRRSSSDYQHRGDASPSSASSSSSASHRPVSVDEVRLWQRFSRSEQSLGQSCGGDEDLTGDMIRRTDSFYHAMAASVVPRRPGEEARRVRVGRVKEGGAFDDERVDEDGSACRLHRLNSDEGSKSRSHRPGFIQRMLQKRKSFHDKPSAPGKAVSAEDSAAAAARREAREAASGRKVSIKGIFKRKNSAPSIQGDTAAVVVGGGRERRDSDDQSSPPIATFLNDDDIGAISGAPGSPGSVSRGDGDVHYGGDDVGLSSGPSLNAVLRRNPTPLPGDRGGKARGSERYSGEYSYCDFDLPPSSSDCRSSQDTLTSTSPSDLSSLTTEGEATLAARAADLDATLVPASPGPLDRSGASADRTPVNPAGPRLARKPSLPRQDLDKLAAIVQGEITSSNSNDSGIQHDVTVGSSESLKLPPEVASQLSSAVKLRNSPSPKQERPKSDFTVRWADLLEQVKETNVTFRRDGARIRKRPRPKSDLAEDSAEDEGVDYDSGSSEEGGSSLLPADLCPRPLPGSTAGPLGTGSLGGSGGQGLQYDSLVSLVELRRPSNRGRLDTAALQAARLAKARRMSTPQPIKTRAEKVVPRSPRQVCLVRSHSMPDNLDRLHRKKNYFSLIGSDIHSEYGPNSGGEDSSDESEFSVDYQHEKSLSTRASRVTLATLDQMIEEENLTYAEALWDHVTMDPDELGFRAGDLIRVTDTGDKHWWYGATEHRDGWFPAAFVRLRVNQDDLEGEMTLRIQEEEEEIQRQLMLQQTSSSPSSSSSKTQLRANVVNEIITAETEYVKHLRDVIEGYLKQARKRPEMFPVEKVTVIFSNIEDIYHFATRLLGDLQHAVNKEQPHLTEFGQCFLHKTKEFEIYSEYCNNHPAACEELREMYRVKRFRHFFEACRLLQEMSEIPLEGFLLTPVQKICKYHLQLAELLKYTPADHPDHTHVQSAVEAMKRLAKLVNERKRKMESIETLAEWQMLVDDWEGPDILDDSSELIYSGELNKINANGWSQERYFFLFDHQLVYCKKDLLKKNSFGYKGRINMDHSIVVSVPDGRDSQYGVNVRNGLKVHDQERNKWFLMVAKTAQVKQRWLKAFSDERRRVHDDVENNFNIPAHLKQTIVHNLKQKSHSTKSKGKRKTSRSGAVRSSKTTSWVSTNATLPRDTRKSAPTLGSTNTQQQTNRIMNFLLGGRKK